MIPSKIEPDIKPYPGFIVMERYDAWHMLFEIFGHYRLNEIRECLWDMYKAAALDEGIYSHSRQRSDLIFFFERLNDLATAAYVVARKKWVKSPQYYIGESDFKSAEIFKQRIKEFEAEQKHLKKK